MNNKSNLKLLPALTAGLGLLAMALRATLFLLGRDEKDLLITGHPLSILTWIATAMAAGLILVSVAKLDGSKQYKHNFDASVCAGIGAFAMAGGIAATVVTGWSSGSILGLVCSLWGVLAIPALVFLALQRMQGTRPFFLLHGAVCLYLTLFSVSQYQRWSSRPQIQDWFFTMGASILLTLFAYCQMAFDADMGNRRMQLSTGFLAAFFCISAVSGLENVPLYMGGAIWALTNLCRLTPTKRRRPNPITEAPQEN